MVAVSSITSERRTAHCMHLSRVVLPTVFLYIPDKRAGVPRVHQEKSSRTVDLATGLDSSRCFTCLQGSRILAPD
jgi:hypothetical protein